MQLTMETRAAEESLKREYESRRSLEKMLQRYKDEVETLKEALNIAAQAVAQAEMMNSSSAEAIRLDESLDQAQEASLQADYDDYYDSARIGAIPEGDESGYDYDAAYYATQRDLYDERREEEETERIEELRDASAAREGSPDDFHTTARDDGSDFEDALES